MNLDINRLKTEINSDLRAEILYYELQHRLKKETTVLTKFDGVSKRSNSKDKRCESSQTWSGVIL